ncbi:MAG TPA: NAD(P)/FAD-dependent oxidoreductase [Candidatus Pullichristensenella avicola]|nr:NAD(P)/FAD-dependent oxidoreductase [Candidatus Pullichristensenella avicola]
MRNYDVAIIGAGVTGCAVARHLSRYRLKIVLIDAAEDVAMGASRANSAIVHAGYDCPADTLMAKMNVRGNALYERWCAELDVPFERVGSLVAAFNPDEKLELRWLYERGLQNGVPDMEMLTGDQARALEPMLSNRAIAALHAKTAGITCPYEMTIACAENAVENGVELLLGRPVKWIVSEPNSMVVRCGNECISAKRIVNAAGIHADDVARMIGDDSFDIRPRKGEYMLFDRTERRPNKVIFHTPTKLGKGVLVAPTVDGNVFAGPTAVNVNDKEDTSVDANLSEVLATLALEATPTLNLRNTIRAFAGLRAQPSSGDFIITSSEKDARMIHAAGICSPGLTSAPAIAEQVEEELRITGLTMSEKALFNPYRKHIPVFRTMTETQRQRAIAENPLYGRVICRCENVTEAEIVEAVRRGARTVDGVKRRTRAGMGRCQGGFCTPRVMEIIAREAAIPEEKITKSGGDSYMVAGKTRGEV